MQTIIKQSIKQRRSRCHILTGLLLSASLLSSSWLSAAPGDISTVAGSGNRGYSGDDGAATAANLSSPNQTIVDNEGNLYISDPIDGRIRKVDSDGIITTVAGNGKYHFSGDGALATAAALKAPSSLAFDSEGNLYIADTLNHRIRKVDTEGVITTVAGNGARGFSGDSGLATAAALSIPRGIAFDDVGNLYIADSANHCIRKVDTEGIITTIAEELNTPNSIAFDSVGNLYIADTGNHSIRKVDIDGIITTVAGNNRGGFSGDNGPATEAQMSYPNGLALDSHNNLYIVDYLNHRIRKIDTNGIITTVAGNGTRGFAGDGAKATAAQLNSPAGVTLDSHNNIYIADENNRRVRKIEAEETSPPALT